MSAAEVAQAIEDLPREMRNDFDTFLCGWLVGGMKRGILGRDVATEIAQAFEAFERTVARAV